MDFQPPDQGQNPPNSQHSISSQLSNQSSQSTISSSQTTVASSQSTANSSQSTAPPSSQSQSTIPGLLSSPSSRFPVQSSQSSFPRSKNSDPFPGSQDLSQHPSSQIAYSGSQFSPQSSQVSQWPGNVQISSSQGSYGKSIKFSSCSTHLMIALHYHLLTSFIT